MEKVHDKKSTVSLFSAHSSYLHVKLSILLIDLLLIAIESNMQIGDCITSLECSKDAGILDRIGCLEVADLKRHLH